MKIQLPRGTRDIMPDEMRVRQRVMDTLRAVFERFGYVPLETPVFERYDILAAKFAAGEGSDALKETFTFEDQGKRKLGLRFDLTVPLARFIGLNPKLRLPFKRYQTGPVFRDGPIKLGRYRQFWQCDVDIVGAKGMAAEADLITLTAAAFRELGLPAEIRINNRKLLCGILQHAKVPKHLWDTAMVSLDKMEKQGHAAVEKELDEKGIPKETTEKLMGLFAHEDVKQLHAIADDELMKEGLAELTFLFDLLDIAHVSEYRFDLSLVRGLSYYTGTVFEAFLKGSEITSSVAGGGRYDDMIGGYLGGRQQFPAVGISFGVDVIFDAIRGTERPAVPVTAFVIPINTMADSFNAVTRLREKGIRADLDLMGRGVSKNLAYVSQQGIPYAIIIGEDEVLSGKCTLRDMASGTEEKLPLDEMIKRLK
ncbi:histidine--tRNA ligase [Candidatus Woesearchaeota archaeon]|nr:histidine--tRNA ligase [Candidatus Woesearchaeota archaeon]